MPRQKIAPDDDRALIALLLKLRRMLTRKHLSQHFGYSEALIENINRDASRETTGFVSVSDVVEFLQSINAGTIGHLTAGPEGGRCSPHSDQ